MSDPAPTRTWRLLGLVVDLRAEEPDVRRTACRALGIEEPALRGLRLVKQSLDARRGRGNFHLVVQADCVVDSDLSTPAMARLQRKGRLREPPPPADVRVEAVHPSARGARVAVVGSGPAGIFAAWTLALHGLRVVVIDRGARLEDRGRRVVAFHRTRMPDPETNLLFGEGGAGTYSDGKLYTRVDDPLEVPLLEELVACGAPPEICYDARAHIGTDRLHRVVPRLRARLAERGVEFAWETRVDGFVIGNGPPRVVRALATSRGPVEADAVVFAPGHSARDTWEALRNQGVVFQAKPFQFGVRIEHPQELITRGRYGEGDEADLLGPAAYSLVCKAGDGRDAAHSFCMCPGGRIVASVNEAGRLCTNGMSNSTHSSRWASAALVTTVPEEAYAEFGSGPLAGVAFQRAFEQRFFEAGGGDYTAPAQRASDFLAGRPTTGPLETSYTFGARAGRIDSLLPPRTAAALRRALQQFDRAIPGFAGDAGLLVGIESRSSGPVRMLRDRETWRAHGFANLFPVGEGAGYAGGIMSAALDGAHAARALLRVGISP